MPDTTCCGQRGCGALCAWARTVRDPTTRTGGRPILIDWPLPVDKRKTDGTVLPPAEGMPVPNVGVRNDQHGTLIARVASAAEPIRADERPAYPHWATCKNPPPPKRTRQPRPPQPAGQDELFHVEQSSPLLSDARLFPRRRRG